jgi:hypothetical protein
MATLTMVESTMMRATAMLMKTRPSQRVLDDVWIMAESYASRRYRDLGL